MEMVTKHENYSLSSKNFKQVKCFCKRLASFKQVNVYLMKKKLALTITKQPQNI